MTTIDTILEGLNDKQREAVTAPDGPLLILAGAGSGKTLTLTRRIAYRIANGTPPSSMLAVTFTNKAAGELTQRIGALLGEPAAMPMVGTFHSVCVRFLRSDIHHLGRDRSFTIADTADQNSIIKRLLKERSIDTAQFSATAVRGAISRAKNALLSAEEFRAQTGSYFEEVVADIYDDYERALRESNALDFDDLIVYTVRLLENYPAVRERYHERFSHILVDEYQDTNHMQYRLVTLLAQKHRNLFIIGDDYQSIYMFRAADITNILNFERDYPDAKVITLEQNYRSTQCILDAATAVIHKNEHQRHKTLWTQNSGGEPITCVTCPTSREEARYVVRKIRAHHSAGGAYRDCVVLYRTNAQSRTIEEACMREGIPYRIVGGMKFYERKEIKDMVAYLRVILNGADRPAVERIINVPPRGIGAKTLAAWHTYAVMHDEDMITAALRLRDDTQSGITATRRAAIAGVAEQIMEYRAQLPHKTLAQLLADIYERSGYKELLARADTAEERAARHDNIGELITIAKDYDGMAVETLPQFLETVSLVADTDAIDSSADAVHLMTLHSAKGLEFPNVFIVGVEEGVLPHSRSQQSQRELEEERRLMYVGMTRAMETLYLVTAQQRMVFGLMQSNPPSRFLSDIPAELVKIERVGAVRSGMGTYGMTPTARTASEASEETFSDGTTVEHPSFGTGMIVAQTDTEYTIAFAGKGIKKITKNFRGLTPA